MKTIKLSRFQSKLLLNLLYLKKGEIKAKHGVDVFDDEKIFNFINDFRNEEPETIEISKEMILIKELKELNSLKKIYNYDREDVDYICNLLDVNIENRKEYLKFARKMYQNKSYYERVFSHYSKFLEAYGKKNRNVKPKNMLLVYNYKFNYYQVVMMLVILSRTLKKYKSHSGDYFKMSDLVCKLIKQKEIIEGYDLEIEESNNKPLYGMLKIEYLKMLKVLEKNGINKDLFEMYISDSYIDMFFNKINSYNEDDLTKFWDEVNTFIEDNLVKEEIKRKVNKNDLFSVNLTYEELSLMIDKLRSMEDVPDSEINIMLEDIYSLYQAIDFHENLHKENRTYEISLDEYKKIRLLLDCNPFETKYKK